MKLFIIVALCVAAAQANTYFQSITTPNELYPSVNSRIVGGFPAASGQFPWQVALQMNMQTGGTAWCGGALISADWVLTAAHCVRGVASFGVRMGSTLLNSPLVTMTSTVKVEHANYNPNNLNNDVGLVRLPSSVAFGPTIRAIRLPTQSQSSTTFAGVKATVSGFGRTSDTSGVSTSLNWVNLTIITNAACANVYGTSVVITSTICANGFQTPQQSTCQGDSGGPLIIYEGGSQIPTQIGVVSFVSSSGCASGQPSGYVRTASFLSWISTNTGIPIFP